MFFCNSFGFILTKKISDLALKQCKTPERSKKLFHICPAVQKPNIIDISEHHSGQLKMCDNKIDAVPLLTNIGSLAM